MTDVPNHGPCYFCDQDVNHVYPWFTADPLTHPDAKPMHEECARVVLFDAPFDKAFADWTHKPTPVQGWHQEVVWRHD